MRPCGDPPFRYVVEWNGFVRYISLFLFIVMISQAVVWRRGGARSCSRRNPIQNDSKWNSADSGLIKIKWEKKPEDLLKFDQEISTSIKLDDLSALAGHVLTFIQ